MKARSKASKRRLAILVAALVCAIFSPAREAAAQAHPHVFFDPSDLASFRDPARRENPVFKRAFHEILVDCRSTYGPGRPKPSLGSSAPRRRFHQGIMAHAALLLVDEPLASGGVDPIHTYDSDRLFFEYFWEAFRDSRWSNFFGHDIFGTPHLLVAFVHGYDWHYDRFTPAERAEIVNGLADRADYLIDRDRDFVTDLPAESDLDDPQYGYLHTFKVLRNRLLLSCAAIGSIAYVLEGEVPESRRQRWIDRTETILRLWAENVSADGMSHEGYAYHEFVSELFFKFVLARARSTGRDAFLEIPYLTNHPIASMYSWVPGDDRSFVMANPFGDVDFAPPSEVRSNAALIAPHLAGAPGRLDELAAWQSFRECGGSVSVCSPTDVANNSYSRADPLQYFVQRDDIPLSSPVDLGMPPFRLFPERGVFVWRSSWGDEAVYFSFICGPQLGGHQQPETGNYFIHRGAPYVGHHGQSILSKTADHNLVLIDGAGQRADRQNAAEPFTSPPQPPEAWGRILQVVADDEFFFLAADVAPAYADSRLREFTREIVGDGEHFFVRDKLRLTSGSNAEFETRVQAYRSAHPSDNEEGAEGILDPDSLPTENPWSGGSGNVWTLRPRTSGIGSVPMTVRDLSPMPWTGRVEETFVGHKQESEGIVRRGNRLVRTVVGRSVRSLTSFSFPESGDSVAPLNSPVEGEDGYLISRAGQLRALGVWTDDGSVEGTSGIFLTGAAAGLDLPRDRFWARDATALSHGGRVRLASDRAVSVFYKPTDTGAAIRVRAAEGAALSIEHPVGVVAVRLDGASLAASQWSYASGRLSLNLPPSSEPRLVETTLGSVPSSLANLSTRGFAGTGAETTIAGFIVSGTGTKRILISGVGPNLADFGVSGVLANPVLAVFDQAQRLVAFNDDWRSAPAGDVAAVAVSGFAPAYDGESALILELPPGAYTAQLSGADATTGVGLVQVFDLGGEASLGNISTRLAVGPADRAMIAGFSVEGTLPKSVLVRGLGPTLSAFGVAGVLPDPRLAIFRDETMLVENDDWPAAHTEAEIRDAGFAPTASEEPLLIMTLEPGEYTAVLTGTGGGSGVGLVEVYALD